MLPLKLYRILSPNIEHILGPVTLQGRNLPPSHLSGTLEMGKGQLELMAIVWALQRGLLRKSQYSNSSLLWISVVDTIGSIVTLEH